MRMPRVKCLLAMFVSLALSNGDAKGINCSSIKVPDVDITYLEDLILEVSWLKNLAVSSFSFSGTYCFVLNGEKFLPHLKHPVCPSTKTLKFEEDPAKKSLQKDSITIVGILGITLHVNLTMQAPGCPLKSNNKSLKTSHKVLKMKPVERLSLTCKPDSLSATWSEKDKHEWPLCYNYTAYEILESGQRKEIANKETDGKSRITSATVYLSHKLHAYKLFQFCVRLRYCRYDDYGLWSDEKCAERRSPAEPPSESLKMLCNNRQNKCKDTIGKTKRNVTLIWELPEKSSWNGRPEKIMITYRMSSKENNDNHNITINATRTNYTLQGLKLYFDYYVTLTFYSNGGKGPGAQFVLKAVKEPVPPEPATTEEEIDPTVLIVIVVASSVLIVAAVIVFTYLIYKLKRKHKLASLPHMQLPEQITAHSGTDPNIRTNPVDYNFLMTSEETEIQANLRDKSSYEKISCNGSNSSESTSDSVAPLVPHMSDPGHDDVTYYPEQAGGKFGSSMTPGERTSDI